MELNSKVELEPSTAQHPSGCYPGPATPSLPPPLQYILIIEATSPAGGVPIFPEGISELLVEGVSKVSRDTLPGQDQDNNHSILTMVACPMPHQAQQLLLQCVSSDHLQRHGTELLLWRTTQLCMVHAAHSPTDLQL